jgi:hypothetical protein
MLAALAVVALTSTMGCTDQYLHGGYLPRGSATSADASATGIYAIASMDAQLIRMECLESTKWIKDKEVRKAAEVRRDALNLVADTIRRAPSPAEAGRLGDKIGELLDTQKEPDLEVLTTAQVLLDYITHAMGRMVFGSSDKGSQMAAPLLKPFSKRLASFAAKAKNGLSKDETVVFQRLREDWHHLGSSALKRRQFDAHRQQIDDITRAIDECALLVSRSAVK